jgi:hypothetical protein
MPVCMCLIPDDLHGYGYHLLQHVLQKFWYGITEIQCMHMETSKNHVPELCIQPFSHKEMRYSLLATMYCIYDFSKDK